jgi:cobalt-zinc-cadmium efflux system membrane fusion protein
LLDASENDLAAVEIGKTVTIRSPTYADADFPAKIVSISDFLDPATRTLKVRATLDNSHRRLKAEMFVTGEFQTRQGLRMQVPAKATFFQGGQHYVFTQDAPARYTRREVRVGDEHDGKVTILSGLQDGQRVVVEDVLMLQQMLQPRRVQK